MRNPAISEGLYRWHNRNISPFDYKQPTTLAERELELAGLLIYKCEGSKARGSLDVTCADPKVILKYLRYLREICRVQESKISIRLHIHDSMNACEAIEYWSKLTGISPERFGKTCVKPDLGKSRKYPFGICSIRLHNIKLQELVFRKLEELQL
jgi:hypothetical protein